MNDVIYFALFRSLRTGKRGRYGKQVTVTCLIGVRSRRDSDLQIDQRRPPKFDGVSLTSGRTGQDVLCDRRARFCGVRIFGGNDCTA
jgi:hypothetical protein